MTWRLAVLAIVAATIGCGQKAAGQLDGGGDGAARDGGADGHAADCGALAASWRDVVRSVSQACTQAGDCALAGVRTPLGAYPGTYAGISWSGAAVNAAAYAQSSASALEADWVADRCGKVSDPVCLNAVTCQDGRCQIVLMTCCDAWTWQLSYQCPATMFCFYDASSSGGGVCLRQPTTPQCIADCAPEATCGRSCCGPGTTCRTDRQCCVPLPDAGASTPGPDGGGADAPPDAASSDAAGSDAAGD